MAGNIRDLYVNVHERRQGRAFDEVADDLDHVGRSSAQTKTKIAQLNREIETTEKHIARLGTEFTRTGNSAIFGDLRKERAHLRELKRILAEADPTKGGFANIGDMLAKIPTRWGAIGGAIAAIAGPGPIAPFLGASLAGLGAGAVGTLGVGGGAAAAFTQPDVRSAAKAFGDSVMDELTRAGSAFAGPVRQAMTILDEAIQDLELPETFAKMAPFVTVIADAFGDMAKNIMPGLNAAFDRMGPFADAAHEAIAELGYAIGTFIDDITASEGAVMGLEAIFKFLNVTIILTGRYIKMLSDGFDVMVSVLDKIPIIGGFLGDLFKDLKLHESDMGDEAEEFRLKAVGAAVDSTKEFINLGTSILDVRDALQAVEDQISGMIDAQLGLDQANLAVEQGWLDVAEAINEHGTALNRGTEDSMELEAAILSQIGNLSAQRDAFIRVTGASDDATSAYDDQIKKLIELGVKAGISRQALEELAGSYYVSVIFQAEMSKFVRDYGHLIPGAGVSEFATGGMVGGPTGVPQLAVVHGGERVLTPEQQFAMAMGGQSPVVISFAATGDAFLDAVIRELRKYIRVTGGTGSNSVQVALGQ